MGAQYISTLITPETPRELNIYLHTFYIESPPVYPKMRDLVFLSNPRVDPYVLPSRGSLLLLASLDK